MLTNQSGKNWFWLGCYKSDKVSSKEITLIVCQTGKFFNMDYIFITRKKLKILKFIEHDCAYILVEEHEPVSGACKNHDLFG